MVVAFGRKGVAEMSALDHFRADERRAFGKFFSNCANATSHRVVAVMGKKVQTFGNEFLEIGVLRIPVLHVFHNDVRVLHHVLVELKNGQFFIENLENADVVHLRQRLARKQRSKRLANGVELFRLDVNFVQRSIEGKTFTALFLTAMIYVLPYFIFRFIIFQRFERNTAKGLFRTPPFCETIFLTIIKYITKKLFFQGVDENFFA